MKNFQEENIFKRIMHSTIGLIFLSAFILFFAWNVLKFAEKARETARNKNLAEEKITELQKEQSQLSGDIDKLNTEKGTEETIRTKFGLAKEGEGLIVIVDDKDQSTDQNKTQNAGFWAKIKNWLRP